MPAPEIPAHLTPRTNFFQPVLRALGPFLALSIVIAFFAVADAWQAQAAGESGNFLTLGNVQRVSAATVIVAVAALGMTLIIISGGIDLSAGTALALCAVVTAWSLKNDVVLLVVHGNSVSGIKLSLREGQKRLDALNDEVSKLTTRLQAELAEPQKAAREAELTAKTAAVAQQKTLVADLESRQKRIIAASPTWSPWSPPVAIVLALLAGGLVGAINGSLISGLRVVPFIVTLGTMTLFLGVAKLIAEETTVRPEITQVPQWLKQLTSSNQDAMVGGMPMAVWITLALAACLAAVLHLTVFGRHVFALGSNEATARLCGIQVVRTKILVYALAGVFTGVAGIYQFSRLSSGSSTSGTGLELKIIAAVVIGGGSLSGGRGAVLGTLCGAAIMAVIESGCTQLGFNNPYQDIILGVIIVAAVTLDQFRQRRLGLVSR